MENSIKEDVREMLAAFARDSECKMNQRIESVNNEVKAVSERTHDQIQALTEVVRHNKSESNSNMESLRSDVTAVQAQIELQPHDMCERMSTFETRVTDLRVMTEQHQIKDCDGNGRIDCEDYAKIHYMGGQQCTIHMEHLGYYKVFKECHKSIQHLTG
ncbi:uncharacterized protein LOC111871853 isoform X2 [Cryptotermes secundus]|uniref:uncharacterized protein LOC111871853 isoform X2 n=1 Tax=Cryptotermes secundus TaxID=105785 RepID=UPI000CD7C3E7|nr:uncharacterized protein LOC111871853 isoform X2 [Cryptotermes secundus]